MSLALVALAAVGLTGVLAWALARIAPALGPVDPPAPVKGHTRAAPTGGGLPVFVFLCALWAMSGLGWRQLLPDELRGLTLGTLVVLTLGLWADRRRLPVWITLGVEVVAGAIVYAHGLEVAQLTNPFGDAVRLDLLAGPLTVLWLLVLTNAVNTIDVADGLAAGVVAIGALALFAVAWRFDEQGVTVLALLLAAVAAGFLPLNWPPARLVLGDAGSLGLGFLMGTISLVESRKATVAVTLLLPIVLMGLPLLDAALATVRRLGPGQPPVRRDPRPLHHRLLGPALSPRRVVALVYGVSIGLGLAAVVVSGWPKDQALGAGAVLALALGLAIGILAHTEQARGGAPGKP